MVRITSSLKAYLAFVEFGFSSLSLMLGWTLLFFKEEALQVYYYLLILFFQGIQTRKSTISLKISSFSKLPLDLYSRTKHFSKDKLCIFEQTFSTRLIVVIVWFPTDGTNLLISIVVPPTWSTDSGSTCIHLILLPTCLDKSLVIRGLL